MAKRIFWSIADNNNLKYYKMMEASFRKFHPTEELRLFGEKEVSVFNDPLIYYRATPIFTQQLMEEGYTEICKIDADYLIFDKLSDAFEGDFDVAVVNNSNPRDFKAFPYQFLNIHPLSYVNNGFVVIKSKTLVDEWVDMSRSIFFNGFQMKEQDILNILVHGGHYNVRRLDEGDSYWGLAVKGYEPEVVLKDGKPFLAKSSEWPDRDKYIKAYHFAGGSNDPSKGNYRIRFNEGMVKYIEELLK